MPFNSVDRNMFSKSIKTVVGNLGSSKPVGLDVIIQEFRDIHPEYATEGKSYASTSYLSLQEIIARSGILYTSDAWSDIVGDLVTLPESQSVISGRMFLIACCIATHAALYDRSKSSKIDLLPDNADQKKEFAAAVLPFLEALESELIINLKLRLNDFLSERGKEQYSDLKRDANVNSGDGTTLQTNLLEDLKNRLHSDDYNLDDEDILGYDLHANNLFNILTDKQTKPPLNIGVLAPWGRGKTSLMRKVEAIFIEERQKIIADKKVQPQNKPTLNQLKNWLNNKESYYVQRIPYATVWFNPWNYQSSEMIWAGMANAVVEQVVGQMPDNIAKETFWLQLQLARVDKNELRKELQLRAALFVLQFIVWAIALIISIALLTFGNGAMALGVFGIGSILGVFTSVASYLKPNKKNITEIFEKYTKAPQYLNKLGTFHDVQEDLKKVFKLLISDNEPLVVFVDDLDRCSPSKVVEVVEAINVFISGEHRQKCFFVLGMDAEIVAASLDVAYEKMKGKVINRETEQGSLGWYFLDKFIQLPFFIPIMNESKKLQYLEYLLKQSEQNKNDKNGPGPQHDRILNHEAIKDLTKKVMAAKSADESSKLMNRLNTADIKELDKAILKHQVENNSDREAINEQVTRYSIYLNSDPRTLKRFANLLRFYNSYQVLRMKKKQNYIPVHYLGKYLVLMLKFPQLVRWLQWDTENKNGISTNAANKSKLIDDAIAQLILQDDEKNIYKYWHDSEFLATGKKPYEAIKLIIDMQQDMTWLKSQNLLNILLSESSLDSQLGNALDCNVW